MTTKLRLVPLPKADMIKITLTLNGDLKRDLDRYAELHAKVNGEPIDVTRLIPHILDAFLKSDRAFRRSNRPGP